MKKERKRAFKLLAKKKKFLNGIVVVYVQNKVIFTKLTLP
jgi:hypothetical protein